MVRIDITTRSLVRSFRDIDQLLQQMKNLALIGDYAIPNIKNPKSLEPTIEIDIEKVEMKDLKEIPQELVEQLYVRKNGGRDVRQYIENGGRGWHNFLYNFRFIEKELRYLNGKHN